MPLDERVLVIPEEHFRNVGFFEGFRRDSGDYAERLLDRSVYSFLPRSVCETDPRHKQLIPYVVLTCGPLVFHYRRGSKATETRLAALRSVGIGGHISEADAAGDGDPYRTGMQRELDEEIAIADVQNKELLGFIYDPRTTVGSVHLGIVHRFELTRPMAATRDDVLIESGFAPQAELLLQQSEFETWSQLALAALCEPWA